MLLMCSRGEGHRCEVAMVTFLLIGRINEARMNLLELYGEVGGNQQ